MGAARTRTEEVFARLRADILGGRIAPGQKLLSNDLCATYEVSVGVVREALSRLSELGLVQNAPQQGFFVTSISKSDLLDLTVARREIESLTLRHAMRNGDIGWESAVLAAHHRLAATPLTVQDDPLRLTEEWASAHSAFHEALLEGSGSPRLTAIANQLRASAELYRRWSLPHEGSRDIAGEHQALLDAVLRRDVELGVELLDRHISLTTEVLLSAGFLDGRPQISK